MSVSIIKSATSIGLTAQEIEIEADLSNGLPSFTVVGLPDKAVEESKERVRSAIKNSNLFFPDRRITVNLAPADVKKEGPIFDLAIAVALLSASGQLSTLTGSEVFLGELSLDGRLRHTDGILPIVHELSLKKECMIFIPEMNVSEVSVIEGLKIYPVSSLSALFSHINGESTITPVIGHAPKLEKCKQSDFDLRHIKGQEHAKRALVIAAAGGHNIIFSGPPGSGKTMLAKSLVSILPPLDPDEMIELTKIYSVAGLLSAELPFVSSRPFRGPHHTSSDISLVGGGRWPKPGEITLAHRGVLFLDELPEFSRSVLEVLRQPLEDGSVNVSRAASSVTFPAQFLLIASQNPCPCGFLGDPKHSCNCTPSQISRYEKKVSGPLLDRIDIHLTVPRVEITKLSQKGSGSDSESLRNEVIAAREIQKNRYKGEGIRINSEMNQKHIEKHLRLDPEVADFANEAAEKLSMSARGYFRTLKLARTIADLEGSREINVGHIAEALQYRAR